MWAPVKRNTECKATATDLATVPNVKLTLGLNAADQLTKCRCIHIKSMTLQRSKAWPIARDGCAIRSSSVRKNAGSWALHIHQER